MKLEQTKAHHKSSIELLTRATEIVDRLNGKFYDQLSYPSPANRFDCYSLQAIMTNQEIGDWRHKTIPTSAEIWVAGCGTNHAVLTALRFPEARVVGSDVSKGALWTSSHIAEELGIRNLELREESIFDVTDPLRYDYIICTGVIHHTADPAGALRHIAAKLKESDVIELMVYNRFNRWNHSAFQKAVHTLSGRLTPLDLESDLAISRQLLHEDRIPGNDSELADALLQPVEHSYTVDTLRDLFATAELEIVSPVVSIFDKYASSFDWELTFQNTGIQNVYDAPPDLERWSVTNHLLLVKSPMLWFYVQHAGISARDQKTVCHRSLDTVFAKAKVELPFSTQRMEFAR